MNLSRIQLEINGTCPSKCPICLPDHLKTGVQMSVEDLTLVITQMKEAGVTDVTLAGFGSPIDHWNYRNTLIWLRDIFKVAITCRASDLEKVRSVYQANVSIASVEDVKTMVRFADTPTEKPLLLPHMVLTEDLVGHLDTIFAVLAAWRRCWIGISIATPIKLCDEAEHVKCIQEHTNNSKGNWEYVNRIAKRYSPWARAALLAYDCKPRMGRCPWPTGSLMVKANLDVMPCCYLPCAKPIGNLRDTTLLEIAKGNPHKDYLDYCAKCPDIGG